MNNREAFEVACELLPEGITWGEPITPSIVQHIAALVSQVQPPKIRHELKHDWIEDMRLGKTSRNTCACCGVMFIGDRQRALCKPCQTSHESETIVKLINTIQYMVGIAERGSGKKCSDEQLPEKFLLDYVKSFESQAQQPESKPALKVVNGEICYQSTDDDQAYGMWCPVVYDTVHDFVEGTKFFAMPPAPEGDKPCN